jgi:hypothetical protein
MNFPHLFAWVRMLLLTALAASGCLAASTTPSSMRLVSGDSISLVPVESPPLLAPSLGTQPVASSVIPVLVAAPEGVLQPGGRILASVGGIIALVQIAAAGRSTGEPRTLEELLADPATWLPTRALADETAAQLSKGCSCSVATATQYVRLPVRDRAATWHMENWYRPIRAWYAEDSAGGRYAQAAAANHRAILEVGLINYEWEGSRFIVQVLMKLIDPRTGQVIGRTRRGAARRVGPVERVLADGVAPLKDLFADMTRPLVATALQDLGLIQR